MAATSTSPLTSVSDLNAASVVGNMGRICGSTIRSLVTASIWHPASKGNQSAAFRSSWARKRHTAVKGEVCDRQIDFVMVKGKTEPEVIYAIAGREEMAHSSSSTPQPDDRNAGVLSEPRLGRCAGRYRAGAGDRCRPPVSNCSTVSTSNNSITSKRRRPQDWNGAFALPDEIGAATRLSGLALQVRRAIAFDA